jgi:1-deoxy-D-xylulose-5-phosphate synthase
MLSTAFSLDGPSAVRYPRGVGPGVTVDAALTTLPIGKGRLCRRGKRVALLAFGAMLAPALAAAESLDATVVDMRFVKPLDQALILSLAAEHELLVTIEENAIIGGAGAEVGRVLEFANASIPLLRLGLPDRFIDHGDSPTLLAQIGLDSVGIMQSIRQKLNARTNS